MISALSKHCRSTLNWKPTHTNEQEKIIKVFQTGKEEAHLSPFADKCDSTYRKSHRIHKKTTRAKKQIQQSCKVQDQYTIINSVSRYQQ